MKMSVKFSLFFSFFLLFLKANAFNVTQILSQYPNFSNFNNYLTQTNLVSEINSRQTITVLAVENDNLSPLSGKSSDVLKNILSVHVILDYFDVPKLQKLTSGSTTLTTLFQSSGLAKGQQGFLNVSHPSTDSVAFASVVSGATPGSHLVKSIVSKPYNISVLQVSKVIIPQGIDGPTNSAPNNSASASPSIAPSAGPKVTPTPSMSPSTSPNMVPSTSPSIAPTTSSRSLAPSHSPTSAESPTEVLTPSATPDSPPMPSADAPTANAPVADAPGPGAAADVPPNAGITLQIDLVSVFTMALSTLCLTSRI
ncbi:hypothetical protein BUALT_Bualt02G0100000 [Buddleja alternifolia]|uniref:FAS1 domain-containing protein n=1 Tax=Buddleja alternifolia TaxID=168488 RepID=A0AAV6Y370_9LAMI|nr:hypothetical protein BUALT_Bualt02G0100000 [Buddleja alternifolia]